MTKLSLKEAKRLSIIKWEAHVKAGGYCEELPEELSDLEANCGFCERYYPMCENCELPNCMENGSLFDNWADIRSIENAQKILDTIKSIPDDEPTES